MILAYLEHTGERLPKTARVAIRAALSAKDIFQASRVVGVVIGGSGVERAADEAAECGLDEVECIRGEEFERYLAIPFSEVLIELAERLSVTLVMAAATARGKDLMPRVAQALQAAQASDVIAINADGTFRRPMYAGNVIADVELLTTRKVVTVRTTAFGEAPVGLPRCPVVEAPIAPRRSSGQEFVSFETIENGRPELTEAAVVVSGGRALKSAENFEKILVPLADTLGAAIGASRAAVDAGYAPNDWQVGQTGKVVAPRLYIAVGISGAIQHLAGMKDSQVIVAINEDPEAPIFEVADYGLVGNLFEVVPELTELLRKARS